MAWGEDGPYNHQNWNYGKGMKPLPLAFKIKQTLGGAAFDPNC